MPDSELGLVERAILLVLVAEDRSVANVELTDVFHVYAKTSHRYNLEKLGLVTITRQTKPRNKIFWELTDRGWKWCADELATSTPPNRPGSLGGAMYAWMANLRRHLDRHGFALADVFGREPAAGDSPELPAPTGAAVLDLDVEVRKAYADLSREPGNWVRLSDLRDHVARTVRRGVDEALARLSLEEGVAIEPESNQKALTARDRAAAVRLGNQDKHVIAIGI